MRIFQDIEWQSANQRYLSLSINLLRRRLENYEKNNDQSTSSDFAEEEQKLATIADGMHAPPAIEFLSEKLQLSLFEKNVLLTCAGVELISDLGKTIASINDSSLQSQPSFAMLLASYAESHWSATSPSSPLRYWRLIEVNKGQVLTQSPLKIDEQILHYLTGTSSVSERLAECINRVLENAEPTATQLAPFKSLFQTDHADGFPILNFFGKNVSDKSVTASFISKQLNADLFQITANALPVNNNEILELARLWNREAALNNYMLVFDCTNVDAADKVRTQSFTNFIEKIESPIVLFTDAWEPELRKQKLTFEIEKPTREEQIVAWNQALEGSGFNLNGGVDAVVSQFNLSTRIITKAAKDASVYASTVDDKDKKEVFESKLWKECCKHTSPQLDDLAQRIEPIATWKDLVLPEKQRNTLREIVVQVKYRHKVYNNWGFASKGSRGLGISVLFAGESGTGKTMAAEVLANNLHLDLYKIDLSKVVNKYIGETEKNLKKIFDAAEDGGAILLFDEADALFGKRSDVKDSHDRYSNIEVSYLLQRMEAYNGLAILTTNMKTAMDKAFMRRIRFVVQFPFPDASQRSEIWSKVFPDSTPKAMLDLDRLSKFTIAGGNIKNIALNAAFHAASENDEVQMKHIIQAARTEYDKLEKQFNNI